MARSWFNTIMNGIDASLLTLLLMADLAFFAYLRRRCNRAMRAERVMRSLARAVRREASQAQARPRQSTRALAA